MFSGRINNCFDSHCHWAATGEFVHRLDLSGLQSCEEVVQIASQVSEHHRRGEWIIGFGWDQNLWLEKQLPHRRHLDEAFPDQPVSFSRIDGHATWVNTKALQHAGWLDENGKLKGALPEVVGGKIILDNEGLPSGVLIDAAKSLIDNLLPNPTANEMQSFLMTGMREFHRAGFTHIRDMTCSELQWSESVKLDESGLLNLGVLQTFSAEVPEHFDRALDLAKRAAKGRYKHLKVQSMKIYYDGALGSEGALLSQPYRSGGSGLCLLTDKELADCMLRSWQTGLDIAVHTIGDEAVHRVAQVAVQLWDKGHKGHLHLEHVELMRPETARLLRGRPVTCHMQPCHWLTDQKWLKEKIGDLIHFAFPWALLQDNDIVFDFGSDSPIEEPSVTKNMIAVKNSAQNGIPVLKGESATFHSYQDPSWIPNTYTIFQEGRPVEVVFQGEHLI